MAASMNQQRIAEAGVTQIPDAAHAWLAKGYDPPADLEAEADAAIAKAKAELRERCDRTRAAEPLEVTVIKSSDLFGRGDR
jgi:hypothetical protein